MRGICATNDATGLIAKIDDGVSQHAKEPTPKVPLSQQYSVVEVIAPSQNLIPAVESVAKVVHWSRQAESCHVGSVQPTLR